MKALTIGSAMIDTIAIIPTDRIERMSMINADRAFLLMEEGTKTEAEVVSTHLGGGAANTAVSFARQGFDARVLVKLGQDERGNQVTDCLEAAGVSTNWAIRDAETPTGASVLISSHERNAGIFTFRGANTKLTKDDLEDEAFAVDLAHIGSLSNESAALFPVLIDMAKAGGARVSANPGMRQLSARRRDFLRVLPKIDILFINRVEAEALMPALVPEVGEGGAPLPEKDGQLPPLATRGLSGGGFDMSLKLFFAGLADLSKATIVVTDGGKGAYAAADGRISYCPPLKIDVAGTAGAGDAFASTFAGFSAGGAPIEAALRAATVNAASVISHVGTQTGLLDKAGIEDRASAVAADQKILAWKI